MPISFGHTAHLTVEADPPPESVKAVVGGTDPRSVAVAIEQPDFVPEQ